MNNEYLKFFKDNNIELTSEQENNLILKTNNENFELLNELATIYRESNLLIRIDDEGSRNFYGYIDAVYFKVYNSSNYNAAKKENRIYLSRAQYNDHSNERGKEDWFLNSSERRNLVKVLKSKLKDGRTVWETICDFCKIPHIEMPDYMKLPMNYIKE